MIRKLSSFIQRRAFAKCEDWFSDRCRKSPVIALEVGAGKRAHGQMTQCVDAKDFDLNYTWPFDSNLFGAVYADQVIEHLHNTRFFLSEARRVLQPGGQLILATENLCSVENIASLVLGYAPLSSAHICGVYLGNPLSMHAGKTTWVDVPQCLSAYSGVSGHVRVMAPRQLKELLELCNFRIVEFRTFGSVFPSRGHYMGYVAEAV